jgi:hypothetical protein
VASSAGRHRHTCGPVRWSSSHERAALPVREKLRPSEADHRRCEGSIEIGNSLKPELDAERVL